MPECQKCDESWSASVVLYGGYCAVLCTTCRNLWFKYLRNCETCQQLLMVQAKKEFMLRHDDILSNHLQLVKTEISLENQLFDAAKEWVLG